MFTDASPKDAHLFGVVKALSLEKQSKVYAPLKGSLFFFICHIALCLTKIRAALRLTAKTNTNRELLFNNLFSDFQNFKIKAFI